MNRSFGGWVFSFYCIIICYGYASGEAIYRTWAQARNQGGAGEAKPP